MPRSLSSLSLAVVILAGSLLAPLAAHAGEFAEVWRLRATKFKEFVGNTDGDPQAELMTTNTRDDLVWLIDGLIEELHEFTGFSASVTTGIYQDIDGDGRLEVILFQPGAGPRLPLTRAYKWTPGGYVTLLSHNDPISGVALVRLRSNFQFELLEQGPTDVRVRDMNGNVLFRASTKIGGWSGVEVGAITFDVDGDGIDELAVMQRQLSSDIQTSFFNFSLGSFVSTWSTTGWRVVTGANTDSDPQAEMLGYDTTTGEYSLKDGLTGALALDLPEFTVFDNAQVNLFDYDAVTGDGHSEIFAYRQAGPGVTPLIHAFEWNGNGNYAQKFTLTDNARVAYPVPTTFAGVPSQYFVETSNDVLIYDMGGNLQWRASSSIPGWTGAGLSAYPMDLTNDGAFELLIRENNTARVVRYVASTSQYQQLWSSTAWEVSGPAPRTENSTNPGLFAVSTSDRRYGLLDPLTGAVRVQFPGFTLNNSGLTSVDFDRDGVHELILSRLPSETPLTECYRWNGSSYALQYSHTDGFGGYLPGPYRPPGAGEVLELLSDDVIVRAPDGSTPMRASTDIDEWTGVDATVHAFDVDNDGILEILAIDGGGARLMRWTGLLDVEDGPVSAGAARFGNFPNPFHATTALQFSTRSEGQVGIAIYDAGGRLVRRLDQRLPAGNHSVKWDGRDARGLAAPNGVLFYEVRADGVKQTRKMVHLGN